MTTDASTQARLPDSATDLAESIVRLTETADVQLDRNAVVTGLGAGLAFFFTQPPCRDFPVLAECHDFALPQVAGLFGIHLRAMHPPRARHGLSHSSEFADHFVDSYVPLIQRALQNGQKVLTFRGWPPEVSATWGIVDRSDCEGGVLWGEVPNHPVPIQLKEPALQCYVVEQVTPTQPSAAKVLLQGATAAVQLCERGAKVYPGLVTEEIVFNELIDRMQTNGGPFEFGGFRSLIRRIEIRRTATARFLIHNLSELEPEIELTVPSLVLLCGNAAETCNRMLRKADAESKIDPALAIDSLREMVELNREIMKITASLSASAP